MNIKHTLNVLLLSFSSISAIASSTPTFDSLGTLTSKKKRDLTKANEVIEHCTQNTCDLPENTHLFINIIFSQLYQNHDVKAALLKALSKNGHQINLSRDAEGHMLNHINSDDAIGIQTITDFCQEEENTCLMPEQPTALLLGALSGDNPTVVKAIMEMLKHYQKSIHFEEIPFQALAEPYAGFSELIDFCTTNPGNCYQIDNEYITNIIHQMRRPNLTQEQQERINAIEKSLNQLAEIYKINKSEL